MEPYATSLETSIKYRKDETERAKGHWVIIIKQKYSDAPFLGMINIAFSQFLKMETKNHW